MTFSKGGTVNGWQRRLTRRRPDLPPGREEVSGREALGAISVVICRLFLNERGIVSLRPGIPGPAGPIRVQKQLLKLVFSCIFKGIFEQAKQENDLCRLAGKGANCTSIRPSSIIHSNIEQIYQ
ncbi:MAG: hypothetical protein AB9866_14985 [Syntrophobacteraceae bacterium]